MARASEGGTPAQLRSLRTQGKKTMRKLLTAGMQVFDERGVALPVDPSRIAVDAPVLLQRDTSVLRMLGAVQRQTPALYRRASEVRRVGTDELLVRLDSVAVRALGGVTPQRLWDIQPVEQDLARRQRRVVELDLRFRDQVIARVQ